MTAGMAACLALAVILNSCTKEKRDVTELLSTVPSSAGAVVGVNVGSILEKAGYIVNGSEIKPGKGVRSDFSTFAKNEDSMLEIFFNADSGTDPTGAIFFHDANRTYLTFGLSDTSKFKKFIEQKNGASFNTVNGVEVCGNTAMKGAQAWILISNREIDPDAIIGYASLSESQSFLQQPFGEEIKEMEHDMAGWTKLKVLTRLFLDMQETTMFNLLASTFFEDPDEAVFEFDFLKGKFEAELKVLNSKGKPAKYLLPADKIDAATVKSIAKNADIVMAATISPKLLEKLDNLAQGVWGHLFDNFKEIIKDVDGTVAIGLSNPDDFDNNLSGVITTTGSPSLLLKSLVSNVAPMRMDGKLLRFSKGTMNGEIEVAKAADMLKGCSVGIVTDIPAYPLSEISAIPLLKDAIDDFDLYCLKLDPEDNSVELKITIESKNKGENILKSVFSEKK